MARTLWVEAYRPKTLDEYVWQDNRQRQIVESWIANRSFPHLLLSGIQGSGKTSLAELLIKECGIQEGDVLRLNASRERNVDTVQTKITNFVSTWPLGDYKVVLLDEADSMSPLAQRVLRGEMERYADTARFILTANYPQKIIPAVHSRVQGFEFKFLDRDAYIMRTVDILQAEEVEFEPEVLMEYVEATYPDLRKCINLLQQHSTSGTLELGDLSEAAVKDYVIQFVDLFNAGKFIDARKLVVSQAQPEEYNDLYRYFYEHLDLWGDTEQQQDEALLAIRRAVVDHATAGDPEILMASLLVELKMIKLSKGK